MWCSYTGGTINRFEFIRLIQTSLDGGDDKGEYKL